MKDTLEESNMLVDHVNKLLIIDTELSAVQSKKAKNNSYLQIMKHLDTARKYLEQECGDIEYLDIYKTISETITLWYSDSYKVSSFLFSFYILLIRIQFFWKRFKRSRPEVGNLF